MNDLKSLRIKQLLGNMRDWIAVRLKCLVGEKKTLSAIWKLIYTAIGYASSIFAFAILLKDMMSFDKVEIFCKDRWWLVILIGVIASLVHNHEKINCKGTMENDDLQIVVKVSDLFCINASSYVIPTNTFFRTVMEGEYISPQSVQGAFQLKYFNEKTDELDNLIAASLEQQGIVYEESSDIHGTVKKYPIGTVAKVDHKSRHYYFVAINDVNRNGKPENQGYANVDIALSGLIQAINKIGHCDDLAMPLIGTGRAAIREATIEKVVENTVDRFLMSTDKICRKLIICVRPKDYLEGKADLKKIQKYIDYKCEFK